MLLGGSKLKAQFGQLSAVGYGKIEPMAIEHVPSFTLLKYSMLGCSKKGCYYTFIRDDKLQNSIWYIVLSCLFELILSVFLPTTIVILNFTVGSLYVRRWGMPEQEAACT